MIDIISFVEKPKHALFCTVIYMDYLENTRTKEDMLERFKLMKETRLYEHLVKELR